MFSTVQLLILIAAVAGSGAMVGVLAWLVGRLRRLEGGGSTDRAALEARVARVEEELETAHRAVARLEEHASFTARLLEGRPTPESEGRGVHESRRGEPPDAD